MKNQANDLEAERMTRLAMRPSVHSAKNSSIRSGLTWTDKVFVASVYLLFSSLSYLNIHSFALWPQVIDLWESGATLGDLLDTNHAHAFRYLVVLPGFYLNDVIGAPLGEAVYIDLFLALNVALWLRIYRLTSARRAGFDPWVIVFVLMHFFMNGRGVFAWSAWLLAIDLCVRAREGRAAVLSYALTVPAMLLLGTVSTGVFIVVFVTLLATIVRLNMASLSGAKLAAGLALCIFIGAIGMNYFIVSIEKNIEFYGGIIPMAQHGLGKLGEQYAIALIPLLLLTVLILAIWAKSTRLQKLEVFIYAPLFGGIFGFTVLTLLIPVLLMMLRDVVINRPRAGRKGGYAEAAPDLVER